MHRWASRINLAVTNVRVERLQDISGLDTIHEGLRTPSRHDTRREEFRELWDSLNAKRGHGWDTNPWVWVVEFALEQQGSD
jgi:hypothetical protein